MRVVAIVSQKGGAGKSTLATELGVVATTVGYRVRILDLDPQATATVWGDNRAGAPPRVLPAQQPRLPRLLEEARADGEDLILIDTAAAGDRAALEAAKVSDIVLVPARPSAHDMNAIGTSLRAIREIAKRPAWVVVNQAQVGNAITQQCVDALIAAEVAVCPVRLHFRAAFFKGLGAGRAASEWEPNSKAASEVYSLWGWVCGQVGLSENGPDFKPSKKLAHSPA